jgi:hypothetical protein
LGANIGVLIGIALILAELNQGRRLAVAQFNLDVDQIYRVGEMAMMESNLSDAWATSIENPDALSVSDIRSLDAFYATIINRWRNTFDLERQGLAAEGATARQMDAAPFFFGNSFAVSWWSYDRKNWGPDFAELVDLAIAEVNPSANKDWIRVLQTDLGRPQ